MLADLGDFAPRRLADRLDGLPALADHDLALAFALDINRLLDADFAAAQFLPRLGLDRGLIGQFLVQPLEQFFARDLGGQLPHGRVRHLVRRIKPRTWRHALGEPALRSATPSPVSAEIMKVESNLAFSLAILVSTSSVSRGTRSILLRIRIFVGFTSASRREQRFRLLVDPLARIDQHADQVGLMRAAPGRRHHGAVEPALRRENARRSTKMSCALPSERDAADQRARRLHLVRDDGDLGADQRVEQRRFAGIGRADQRDEAAARVARCLGVVASTIKLVRRHADARQHGGGGGLFGGALGGALPSAGGRSGSTTATRNSGS